MSELTSEEWKLFDELKNAPRPIIIDRPEATYFGDFHRFEYNKADLIIGKDNRVLKIKHTGWGAKAGQHLTAQEKELVIGNAQIYYGEIETTKLKTDTDEQN